MLEGGGSVGGGANGGQLLANPKILARCRAQKFSEMHGNGGGRVGQKSPWTASATPLPRSCPSVGSSRPFKTNLTCGSRAAG